MSFSGRRRSSIFTIPPTLVEKMKEPPIIDSQDSDSQLMVDPTATVVKDKGGRLIPSRYICCLLGFCSFLMVTAQRLNLTMGMVAMINQTALQMSGEDIKVSECTAELLSHANDSTHEMHKEKGTLLWDAGTQNFIVSLSFLGMMLTQTPGGRMSETLGGKQVLVFSLVVASVCNLISPIATDWGPYVLLAVQFIKGLSQGLSIPAISNLMSNWFPAPEKGVLSSITLSGFPGGAVVGGLLNGILCNSDFLGGWPLVFYVFGFLGLILAFNVYFFGSNCPDEDCRITDSEYKYIMSNLDCQDTGKKYKTPWKKITTNVGTWAGVVGMFGQYWITYFFLSVQPTYLGTALHFSHIENGYLNSLPYIPQILVTWLASYASDVLVNKGYASTDIVRKVCNTLSCIGFSFCLLGVAYAGCDKSLNIICLVTALIIAGFGYPASQIVPLDMTIVFAGTLMGIVSTMASISGVIMPLIVGALTSKEQTLAQWSKVFYISAGINFTSGIVFAMFGSAKMQGWDTLGSEDNLAGVDNEAFDEKSTEPCSTKPQETKNGADMSYVIIDRL